jgi:hypothetical protein
MTIRQFFKKSMIGNVVLVDWIDAVDTYGKAVKRKNLKEHAQIQGDTIYSTPGWFMGIVDNKVFLGFNNDINAKEEQYRGVAEIPLDMIVETRQL